MFYVTSEIYLNNDLGSLAVSVDNYPQKRKNHLTITYLKEWDKSDMAPHIPQMAPFPSLLARYSIS